MKPRTDSTAESVPLGAPDAGPADVTLATKGEGVEEWVDLHFFRPLGIRVARALQPTRVSADQVTLWSLVIGLAAGHCFFYTSPAINALGFALFILSDVFDSADGQLARLRGTSTPFGRILDGLSDNARFANLYLHVLARLIVHQHWSWPLAALLTIAAGVSHSYQSAAIDCIRHAFLEVGVGRGSELELPEDTVPTAGPVAPFQRLARGAYAAYVRRQARLCPATLELARHVRQLERADHPAELDTIRAEYRAADRGVVTQCAWLGQNIRFVIVGVPGVLGWIAGFLWFTIIPLNIVLIVLLRTQHGRASRVLRDLTALRPAEPTTDSLISTPPYDRREAPGLNVG